MSLFPQLAVEWDQQVRAQSGWNRFSLDDFQKLAQRYPVTWVITRPLAAAGLDCPYRDRGLAVCRVGPTVVAERAMSLAESE